LPGLTFCGLQEAGNGLRMRLALIKLIEIESFADKN